MLSTSCIASFPFTLTLHLLELLKKRLDSMANYSNIKRERFMPKIHFLEQEFYFVDPVSAIKHS